MHGGFLLEKWMNSKPSALPPPESFQRVRIVLSHTSHPGNIGAAARALKTMGFARLVLVNPKIFPDPQAEAMASGAGDVLANAQVVGSLAEALHGVTLALALTARRRDLATEPLWARTGAAELATVAAHGEVALVFGNETSGLSNEELAQCGRWATIPANPEYSSLNLAAAVQLLCYELRIALGAVLPAPTFNAAGTPATHEEVEGLMAHLESEAVASGFLDPDNPRRLMLRLRRLFNRAGLEKEEVNILRGLLASFRQPTGKQHRQT
jgi:tRNA/rRNA methyltransferase